MHCRLPLPRLLHHHRLLPPPRIGGSSSSTSWFLAFVLLLCCLLPTQLAGARHFSPPLVFASLFSSSTCWCVFIFLILHLLLCCFLPAAELTFCTSCCSIALLSSLLISLLCRPPPLPIAARLPYSSGYCRMSSSKPNPRKDHTWNHIHLTDVKHVAIAPKLWKAVFIVQRNIYWRLQKCSWS